MMLVGVLLNSCTSIDITKRRYRPGFHVDVTKRNKNNGKPVGEAQVAENRVAPIRSNEVLVETTADQSWKPEQHNEEVFASASVDTKTALHSNTKPSKISEFILAPFREVKRQELNSEFRRAVFNKEKEEKYGWSAVSFVSTGIGIAALALLITGIVLFAGFMLGSAFAYWWVFLLTGLLLGVGAMVTGIIGMRQTGSGERRGRGFALAGMITGIVSLAGALIALFWGLIYSVINGGDGDNF